VVRSGSWVKWVREQWCAVGHGEVGAKRGGLSTSRLDHFAWG
jgi:hypothetical protein